MRAKAARHHLGGEAPLRSHLGRDLEREHARGARQSSSARRARRAHPSGAPKRSARVNAMQEPARADTLTPPSSSPRVAGPAGKPNAYVVAQEQLDRAAKMCGLSSVVRDILSQPKNELIINFPVRMDNGEYKMFKG